MTKIRDAIEQCPCDIYFKGYGSHDYDRELIEVNLQRWHVNYDPNMFNKFVNVQPTTVQGIKLNGVKVLGNPLSFGRPKTPLASPNYQMGGLKIAGNQNLQAVKFKKNYNANDTVAGCERY